MKKFIRKIKMFYYKNCGRNLFILRQQQLAKFPISKFNLKRLERYMELSKEEEKEKFLNNFNFEKMNNILKTCSDNEQNFNERKKSSNYKINYDNIFKFEIGTKEYHEAYEKEYEEYLEFYRKEYWPKVKQMREHLNEKKSSNS